MIQQNINHTVTYLPSQKKSKLNEQDMLGTAGKVRANSLVILSQELLHEGTPVVVDHQKLKFILSVWTLNAKSDGR